MAFVKGDPVEASSYVAQAATKKTLSTKDDVRKKLFESGSVNGTLKYVYLRNDAISYNMKWATYDNESASFEGVTPQVRIYNESDSKVFEWDADESSPAVNTYGWSYYKDGRNQSVQIPSSDTRWSYRARLREDTGVSSGWYRWEFSFYQAQTNIVPGERVTYWNSSFGAVTEDSTEDGLSLSKATTGRYGSTHVDVDLSFDGNGADGGSMPDQVIESASTANLNINAFTNSVDPIFVEWNTQADGLGDSFVDEEAYFMDSTYARTLYAQWTT